MSNIMAWKNTKYPERIAEAIGNKAVLYHEKLASAVFAKSLDGDFFQFSFLFLCESLAQSHNFRQLALLGDIAYTGKKWELALKAFKYAEHEKKGDPGVQKKIALCEINLKQFASAERRLLGLVKSGIADEAVYTYLGNIYHSTKNPKKAIEISEKGLSRIGEKPGLLAHLAGHYHNQKEYEISLRYYHAAHEHDRENINRLFDLAIAELFAGKLQESKTHFEAYFSACENPPNQHLNKFINVIFQTAEFDFLSTLAIPENIKNRVFYSARYKEAHSSLFGDLEDNGYFSRIKGLSLGVSPRRNALYHEDMVYDQISFHNGMRRSRTFPEKHRREIVIFGNSVAHGRYNEEDHTIASYIQELCDKELPSEGFGVVSCGVNGNSPGNSLLQLLNAEIKKNSIVVLLVNAHLFVQRPYAPDADPSFMADCLAYFAAHCIETGIACHIFFLPEITNVKNPSQRESFLSESVNPERNKRLQQVEQFFRARGGNYHDLRSIFDRPHTLGEIFVDALHFNHCGNMRIAQAIFEKIAREPPSKGSAEPEPKLPRFAIESICVKQMGRVLRQKYITGEDVVNYLNLVRKPEFIDVDSIGGIVVNCNPFTRGHRYLIEKALEEVEVLYVFVVEEDQSFFPFEDRLTLVKKGLAKFGGRVAVVPSGKFIISQLTFPEYFTKEEIIKPADPTTDCLIFGSIIAPELGITKRFVGEEPNCVVTNSYNSSLKFLLPRLGVELREIPRTRAGRRIISASAVRNALKTGDYALIKKLVPKSVRHYLIQKGFLQLPKNDGMVKKSLIALKKFF